jgi:hypothetical protein
MEYQFRIKQNKFLISPQLKINSVKGDYDDGV